MPATHEANEEPVPSAWSHMVRKPVTTIVPELELELDVDIEVAEWPS